MSGPEVDATKEQLSLRVWLLGHSYPARWINELKEPLDPRHPTRHSIWTPVLDYIQERVYADGIRLRLDSEKLFTYNAAGKDQPQTKPYQNRKRINLYAEYLVNYRPPVLITFGADCYRFAALALNLFDAERKVDVSGLGYRFRHAVEHWNPERVNVFPLLHACVARRDWPNVGPKYSGNRDDNYFKYVGRELGTLLLTNARHLPIWCKQA